MGGDELERVKAKFKKTDNWLMIAKEGIGWEGMDWEFRLAECKLLYVEWINNSALLYSTGNYIHILW